MPSNMKDYRKWVMEIHGWDFDPTPPAAAMAKPKKQNIVDLAEAFKRTYSAPRRIA